MVRLSHGVNEFAMGQVLHGTATTAVAVRRAIQHSQDSMRCLAKRYGINPKTVAKWRKRSFEADLPTGPKESRSTVIRNPTLDHPKVEFPVSVKRVVARNL